MSDPTTRKIGNRAETIVAKELFRRGHVILSRNHKTRRYEIDIISTKDKKIYFTEVKYRKDNSHGAPLDAITRTKYKQMVFICLVTNLHFYYLYSQQSVIVATDALPYLFPGDCIHFFFAFIVVLT